MQHTRARLSAEAKRINKVRNTERANLLSQQELRSKCKKQDTVDLEQQQLSLLNATFNTGLLCPAGEGAMITKPSASCPIALASYASANSLVCPVSNHVVTAVAGDVVQASSDFLSNVADAKPLARQSESLVAKALQSPEIDMSLVDDLVSSRRGIHGFGDSDFAISEHLIESACQHVGFIEQSNKQFKLEHDSVTTKNTKGFDIDESRGVECSQHCQRVFGRYCKSDIKDVTKFNNSVGLVKSIVRVLASKRTVKTGGATLFMGPDTPWPVLLIHFGHAQSSSESLQARLAFRVAFKPLEMDFVHLKQRSLGKDSEDGCLYFSIVYETLPCSRFNCPKVEMMNEFAVWFSQLQDGIRCEVFWDYDVIEGHSVLRIRRNQHQCSSALGIGEDSFASLLPAKEKPPADDPDVQALAFASIMLKHMTKPAVKATKTRQPHNKSTGSRMRPANRKRNLAE